MAKLAAKKSGFVYKPRTTDQIKNRANRKTSKFDSIFKQGYDSYRPKQGDNLIRYLPPTWNDSDHYGYTAFVHRGIGPDNATYLCPRKMLNKPCPICEAQKEAKDAGENEEAQALNTSERVISWVIDRDADDPEKPLIYDTSWTQDRDIVSLCMNERTGEILMIDHPDKGYDVTLKRTGTGMKTKYYGYAIARDDSPIHDSEKAQDEILDYVKENPIPDVLNFYDYDYLKGVLSGKVADKDEDLDKDEDEVVTGRTASRNPASSQKPRGRVVEEDDEEIDEETGEVIEEKPRRSARRQVEEEEEKPARRGPRRDEELDPENEEEEIRHPRGTVKKRPEPVDEEVDEEAEEEPAPRKTAVKPGSNARSRVVEEEADEDEEEEKPAPRRSMRSR